jgi:hypothetical protein
MKATEFCYWLQGLFEIHDIAELNTKQVSLIDKHLQMVFVHEKEQSKHLDFCKNLYGYIKFSNMTTLNMSVTKRVKNALNDLFEHVFEKKIQNFVKEQMQSFPSYHKPGMQLQVNDKDELVRC